MGEAKGRAGWLRPYLSVTAMLALLLGIAAAGAVSPKPHPSQIASGPAQAATVRGVTVGTTPTAGATVARPGESQSGVPIASGPEAVATAGSTRASSGPRRNAIYDQGVTDNSILIGGSTFTSGPAAVYGDQIAVGFAAGVDYINTHGGINGRRALLKVYDDGADPAKQLENVKRLVEVDKVFALSMAYQPVVGQYVDPLRIPVFHEGQFDPEFIDPWWFSMGGPQTTAAFELANFGVRKLGVKSVAIFYLDVGASNYTKAYADQVAKDWEAYGVKVPVEEAFTAAQTSCSNAISAAQAAKVDFIDFEVDASKVINCGVQAQVQGYKPPKGWGGYLIGVPVIHQALGDEAIGMYAFDAFGSLYNVPDYQAEVKKISPKTDTDSSVTAAYFYAALLMRDAIAKLGDNITRERLRQTLDTFSGWQPGLSTDPDQPSWTWTPTCHLALHGGYVIQVHRHADGSLAWDQVTPQFASTPLPPGMAIPPGFASCPGNFSQG